MTRRSLAHLQAAELLFEAGLFPELTYTFKHALTQEVAYKSLLQDRRRTLHARIVKALERMYPNRMNEQVERLAHHALQGEVWDNALVYLRQASAKALARSANREAVIYLEQALMVLQHLPESRDTCEQGLDLRFDLRYAFIVLGEYERIFDHMCEAEILARTLGDQRRLGRVFWCMTQCFREMSDHHHALESGQRALDIASALADVPLRIATHKHLGQLYYLLGDYPRAADLLRWSLAAMQGESISERFGMTNPPSVHSRACLVRCLAGLGAFAEGITCGEEALRMAEALEYPHSLITACQGLGFLYLRKGDLHKAIPLLERGLELCRVTNILFWLPIVASMLSSAYTLAGRVGEALPLLREALVQTGSMKITAYHQWRVVYWVSEAYPLPDRKAEVLELVRRAVQLSGAHKERGAQAWTLRLLGEIHSHQDPPEIRQAEACYRESLALASELGMRPLLSHCHLGLGAVYHQLGRLAESRSERSAAIKLYRAMEIAFWLIKAETALAQAE